VKVGFDAKRLFNNFTGLGNYSRFVVSALRATFPGDEYRLYTPKIKANAETQPYLNQYQVTTPAGLWRSFSSAWRSYILGNVAATDGVQVFHGLSNELPLTKPQGLKTVLTVHDLIFLRFPEFYSAIDSAIYKWKLRQACASADVVVAVSQQTQNDLVEFLGVDPTKMAVVYQGCHPSFRQTYTAEALRQVADRYKLPGEFILNVGTIEPRKNLLTLVKALHQSRVKVPLVVVGKSTPYAGEVKRWLATQASDMQVLFLQQLAFDDLPKVYQLATLFVYPSVFEGFGIPILEGLVSRVPVISSKGSCFSEAGGPGVVYVNPTNLEEMGEAIKTLLHDNEKRSQVIAAGVAYSERFLPDVIATNLMKIYRDIVD
jgi:glycosyltransferase involved in cell wall biosynthesis